MVEIWKPITGWEGFYEISNTGQVRSLCFSTMRIRKQRLDKDGYKLLTIKVRPREKTIKVHREVLSAFVGPCPDGSQVNHINGDRADNRLENLEYVTIKENCNHAWKTIRSPKVCGFSKIDESIAVAIRNEYQATHKLSEIAEKYGMSRNAVWLVGTGKTWKNAT